MEDEKCNEYFTTSNRIFTKSNFMQLDLMNYLLIWQVSQALEGKHGIAESVGKCNLKCTSDLFSLQCPKTDLKKKGPYTL